MPTTDYIFTGLQPFWNYDSFSIAPRRFGGGIGYINTGGGIIQEDTGEHFVIIDFNFMFSVSDLALKFHNNSPFINRFWNSTEDYQDTHINDHFGLFGKWWICNYEHCLIEDTGNNKVTEIGPTGERNVYTESGGAYTAPNGVLKDMSKASGEFDVMTRDHVTCHFKQLANDESNLYRLEYIKDKNNVRVYVKWELVDGKYRIDEIQVSTDSGTTKTPVLYFKYQTIEIDSTDYHFISQVTDNANRTWSYTYDTDHGVLTNVRYPAGIEHVYEYDTEGGSPTYMIEKITDPNKNEWEIDYTNDLWKISVGGTDHNTYYHWAIDSSDGYVTCTRRDARSSSSSDDNYRQVFTHNQTDSITGNLTSHKTTDTSSATWIETEYTWTNNQLTRVKEPNAVAASANDYTDYSYNADKMLEYVKKYDDNVEQTRYRVKYSYNSGTDKYELASVEKDFSDGTYYFTKTDYTYDANHNLIKTTAGINTDPGAQSNPIDVSINAITIHEYDDYGNIVNSIDPEGNGTTFEYCGLGALATTTNAMGYTNSYEYDTLSLNMVKSTDANGNVTKFTYDSLGQMMSTTDATGNKSSTTYDSNGSVLSRTSGAGTVSMVYDEKNRLTESTDRGGLTTYTTYAKNDQKTDEYYYMLIGASQTKTEYKTEYTYHNSGRLHEVTDAESQDTTYTYDKTGNVLTVTDPNSNTTVTNEYNFTNQLLSVVYQRVNNYLGSVMYEYEGPMALTSFVTRRSNDDSGGGAGVDTDQHTSYTYDRLGRLHIEEKPMVTYGGTSYVFHTFNYYDNNGGVVKVINRKIEDGEPPVITDRFVINEYDRLGRLMATRSEIVTDSGDTVTSEQVVGYGYDANGSRTMVSVNGQVQTRTTYDPLGRTVETIHASGHKQVNHYNVSGEVMDSWFNGEAEEIPYSLDGKGQVKNIDLSNAAHTTSNAYDGAGRQVATTDAAGRTTSREYFPNGWLKRVVRPNGDYIEYTYDKIGRLTKTEEVATDDMGGCYAKRETLEVNYGYGTYTPTSGTGFSVETGYNRHVEYITKKSTTPTYYATVYLFDDNDRLARVSFLDDDDSTTRSYLYKYDGFGNLVLVTKPDTNTIEYTYNGLNQMTQEKFDANNFNDYEYDCCSLIKHQQTVGGSQEDPFELAYDKMHRMTQEQYPDSANPKTEYFDYEYDQAGRRIEMTDPTYGRAAQHPKPMRWKYEEDGKVIKVGRTEDDNYLRNQGEDYHVLYDGRGRIWKVMYPGENNQPVMEVEYRYTSGGQIAKIIARDLTQGTPTDIYCQEFEYDVNGRKIRQVQKEKESDADTAAYYITTFAYDSRDMLVEEKYQRWNSGTSAWDNMYWARYKYDTAGNMVLRVVDQIVNGNAKSNADIDFTYSRGYQLTGFTRTIESPAEDRDFTLTYDANGNMTHISQSATFTDTFYNITEMEFQFDEKNRMTQYRFGGSGSYCQIKYDALGRVRERVNLDPTTTKYYSEGRQLIQQLDSSDNVEFDYFRDPNFLMRQLEENGSPVKNFYILDPLGTVWGLVDSSTLSVKRYNYNAWGEHLDKDDTDFPTVDNSMRYIACRVEGFGKGSTTQLDSIYEYYGIHFIPVLSQYLQRPNSILNPSLPCNNPPYSYYPFYPHVYENELSTDLYLTPFFPPPSPSDVDQYYGFYPSCCTKNQCYIKSHYNYKYIKDPNDLCCCRCLEVTVRSMYAPLFPSNRRQLCNDNYFHQCHEMISFHPCEPAPLEDYDECILHTGVPPCSAEVDCVPEEYQGMHYGNGDKQPYVPNAYVEINKWALCSCMSIEQYYGSFIFGRLEPVTRQYGVLMWDYCIPNWLCSRIKWELCEGQR